MTSVAAEYDHMEIQQQISDGVNNRWDADDWDNENSSARLFERSRIKALAGLGLQDCRWLLHSSVVPEPQNYAALLQNSYCSYIQTSCSSYSKSAPLSTLSAELCSAASVGGSSLFFSSRCSLIFHTQMSFRMPLCGPEAKAVCLCEIRHIDDRCLTHERIAGFKRWDCRVQNQDMQV
ncbi:hypothetical protein XENOCAPTIV_011627 [Xenoophorus captivus]|uniref:Uncharacterized protein n=1 Tax=Xenoophorus captivus TaxID=1517983 RepID=A0ABV0RC38_9TELE